MGEFFAQMSAWCKMSSTMSVWLGLALVVAVQGHGSMVSPEPRNALDRTLPQFANGAWPKGFDGCNCADLNGGCTPATTRPAMNGQSCFWFSQGCTIGCSECTGTGSHTSKELCNSTMQPTNNNPLSRTMNRDSAAGTVNDTYAYNPWRAPGFAPTFDACGMAGGTYPSKQGPGSALFSETPFAKGGDLGSQVLLKGKPSAVWAAGSTVEVSWGIRYNHGGGYQYRLCPTSEPLTEECFQKTPLPFDITKQVLILHNGSRYPIKGTWVSEGTSPNGSTWAMNPIPRINPPGSPSTWGEPSWDTGCKQISDADCRQIPPPCPDPIWEKLAPASRAADTQGLCSGNWVAGQIADSATIPSTLPAGDYVVGWRYDCEETDQVWSNCADVTITK